MPREVPYTPGFLATKILDIGLVTTYFFAIGVVFAKIFDKVYGKFDPEKYKSEPAYILFFEIVFHLFMIGVVAYILRNIVEAIPFPFEGAFGFEHHRLKELEGGVVLHTVLILFQRNLHDKIVYFADRVAGIHVAAEH